MEREVQNHQKGSEKQILQNLRLTKTQGFADTSGPDYEVALCCLVFLRALRRASDFFLYTNISLFGKFDDVILLYRLEGDQLIKYRAILLQAKHKKETVKKKLTSSNPFSIKDYFDSFTQLMKDWDQPPYDLSQVIELEEVSLVLFTNNGCFFDGTAEDVAGVTHHLRDFLDTGGRFLRITEASRVGLCPGPETSDFVSHLTLCTDQMSVEQADRVLEDEISNLFGLTSSDDARDLIRRLKQVVKDWWSEEGKGRCLTPQSDEWRQVLDLQIARLNDQTLTIERQLNVDFTVEAVERFKSVDGHPLCWICVRDEYQAKMTRVMLLKTLRSCLVLEANSLERYLGEVETLWGTFCQTLVLDLSAISQPELWLRQRTSVSGDVGRHLVAIACGKPTDNGWFALEAEQSWTILNQTTRKRLLSVKVDLQGKVLLLRDVIGGEASENLSDKVISTLCILGQEPIKLGASLPRPLDYYVPRCLQRRLSITITLESLKNTNTLIFTEKFYYSNRTAVDKLKFVSLKYLQNVKEIQRSMVVLGVCSDSESRKLCCKYRVKGLCGDVGLHGSERNVCELIPYTWLLGDRFVIVDGVPGVGKSSFVASMCASVKERYPEAWVLRIDMGKQTNYISSRDFREARDVEGFLSMALLEDLDGLERDLLEHSLYVSGNVFLFLDAFDEISPDYTEKCCFLLKGISTTVRFHQMVVTTRPTTSKQVEEVLETKAFNLPYFSDEEQSLFLTQFCFSKGKNIGREEISALRHSAGSVLQIPLLCKMAVEVLLDSGENFLLKYKNPWNRVLLYEFFAEKNIRDSIAVKSGLDVSNTTAKRTLESTVKKQIKRLEELAVKKLMQVEQLSSLQLSNKMPDEKFGLVVDNGESVDFEHQTLAEYFLGRWLARQWKQCPKEDLFQQVLSRDGFELSAATFSWYLFKDFPLHRAVAQGDEVAVRQLVSPGTTDRGGRTALHIAAMTQGKQVKVLELLLDSGEDPSKRDDVLGSTAVQYAETFRNWWFVDELLENGKLVEGLKIFNDPHAAIKALPRVIEQDLINLCKTLFKVYINLFHHHFDSTIISPLHFAASNNSIGIMKLLLEWRDFVNLRNFDGETALFVASHYGHKEAVQLLLENGSDPNIITEFYENALMSACRQGHLDIVDLLIDKGANINAKNLSGNTAFMLAAGQGNIAVLELLIEKGVDPNLGGDFGHTALMMAAYEGHLQAAKFLIEKGAKPNTGNGVGPMAFMLAAEQGHVELLKLLIEMGADWDAKTREENTAFLMAAERGHLEIVKLLIDMGAHPNTRNRSGYTALMVAARQGLLDVVKELIENGADISMKNENGSTALMMAANKGFLDVVKELIENGAEPGLRDENDNTALNMAAVVGHLDIAQLLIENGEDPNKKNKLGDSAFLLAAYHGHLPVVRLFLENGADINMKNKTGSTALMLATDKGNLEVVELLREKGAADPDNH